MSYHLVTRGSGCCIIGYSHKNPVVVQFVITRAKSVSGRWWAVQGWTNIMAHNIHQLTKWFGQMGTCSGQSKWGSFRITAWCHYNAINFLKKISRRHHSSPIRAKYGVSFVDQASGWYLASVPANISAINQPPFEFVAMLREIRRGWYSATLWYIRLL